MCFSCEFIVNEKKRKIPRDKNVYLVKKNARFRKLSFSFGFLKAKKSRQTTLEMVSPLDLHRCPPYNRTISAAL